jgi:hypothetical protein
MASTRNNNTPGDYCLQQRSYRSALGYDLYKYKRVSSDTRFPCFGINVGQVPNTQLSCNPINTESFLYGINATNLVDPEPKFTTVVKCMPGIEFFNRPQAYLPPPLVMPSCQRPQGPFC